MKNKKTSFYASSIHKEGGRLLFIIGEVQKSSCTWEHQTNCAKGRCTCIFVTPWKTSLTVLNSLIFQVFLSSNAPPFVAWSCGHVGEHVNSLLASPIRIFDFPSGEGCSLTSNWALGSPNQGIFKPKLVQIMPTYVSIFLDKKLFPKHF